MLEYQKTHGTVYVVDDDEAIRDSIRWLLEASDYNVELYESGESFIAHYNPETIAVLLLDIRMNSMSGLEIQNFLREKKADLPIIFITGHGDVPMAVNALKKGAVDFIEKPFDLEFLKHLIEKLLDATREKRNQVNRRNFNATLLTRLKPREQQVLERIVAGRLKFLRISRQIKCTTVQSLREFFSKVCRSRCKRTVLVQRNKCSYRREPVLIFRTPSPVDSGAEQYGMRNPDMPQFLNDCSFLKTICTKTTTA